MAANPRQVSRKHLHDHFGRTGAATPRNKTRNNGQLPEAEGGPIWPAGGRRAPSVAEQHPRLGRTGINMGAQSGLGEECGDRVEMERCKGV